MYEYVYSCRSKLRCIIVLIIIMKPSGRCFKRFPGRICRRYQERLQALESMKSGKVNRESASADDIAKFVDAIIANKTAYFGVTKLCQLDVDGMIVDEVGLPGWVLRLVPAGGFPMTFLSFSVLMNRDQITACLLRCGADPSLRLLRQFAPGYNDVKLAENWVSDSDVLRLMQVLPLYYAVYVVNQVVAMRLGELRHKANIRTENNAAEAVVACGVCFRQDDLVRWSGHDHFSCESCLWRHLVVAKTDIDWGCHVCASPDTQSIKCHVLAIPRLDRTEAALIMGGERKAASKELYLQLPEVAEREIAAARGKGSSKRGTTKFRAKTLTELAYEKIGHLRSTRSLEFTKAILSGDLRRVRALINSGVDIDGVNEYGLTALSLACYYGRADVVEELVWKYGASLLISDNSDCTALHIAYKAVQLLHQSSTGNEALPMRDHYQRNMECILNSLSAASSMLDSEVHTGSMSMLNDSTGGCAARDAAILALVDNCVGIVNITNTMPRVRGPENPVLHHPGTGSFLVDNCFSADYIAKLHELWKMLPAEPKCEISGSERSYYFDSQLWVGAALSAALQSTLELLWCDSVADNSLGAVDITQSSERASTVKISGQCKFKVLPTMRFLHYTEVGGYLPAHVDLSRTEVVSGMESTHTFILYLSDCNEGGETVLLDRLQLGSSDGSSLRRVAPVLKDSTERVSDCMNLSESMKESNDSSTHGRIEINDISDGAHCGNEGNSGKTDIYEGRIPLAKVQPKYGRLLVFPHLCPHMGNTVRCVPKLLLRGELLLVTDH